MTQLQLLERLGGRLVDANDFRKQHFQGMSEGPAWVARCRDVGCQRLDRVSERRVCLTGERRPVAAFDVASHFQSLFVGSIDERHTNDRRRRSLDGHQTFAVVRGDRVWARFVTEGSDASQDRPEGGGWQRYENLLRLSVDDPVANAPVSDSPEFDVAADARLKSLIGQPNDAVLRRRESAPQAIFGRLGWDHGTPRISFTSDPHLASRLSSAGPGSNWTTPPQSTTS